MRVLFGSGRIIEGFKKVGFCDTPTPACLVQGDRSLGDKGETN